MHEADAEMSVVGVVLRGVVEGLKVEERFVRLGRAVILGVVARRNNLQGQ